MELSQVRFPSIRAIRVSSSTQMPSYPMPSFPETRRFHIDSSFPILWAVHHGPFPYLTCYRRENDPISSHYFTPMPSHPNKFRTRLWRFGIPTGVSIKTTWDHAISGLRLFLFPFTIAPPCIPYNPSPWQTTYIARPPIPCIPPQ